ncbi:SAC3 domain-containing protein 1 isoform X1 [Bombus huntii]|uniref:SAC3 domain-containing protein 1 isoform X1 n=2 Tax=Bombus huntii TaxID=85661 RepID=UPI0021AA73B1|nr:SAC3 domain-containing protein 1 isoform X1 [Bombus huntii]
MTEFIQGTCLLMCPDKERWIREKEGLLHKFEINENTKGAKLPKADPAKTIKCFSRPAAGLDMTDMKQLRPAPVLLSTIRYLFTKIATRNDVDWVVVYDFIFDRIRSIRQDAAIQRIDAPTNIRLLESIVRFLVYSEQRLCERSISEFNAKINEQHLAECIMRLLNLYDEFEDKKNSLELNSDMKKLMLNDDRPQMEALYILLHMGNTEALMRGLQLPPDLRKSPNVQLSIKISFAWYLKNYVRVCSLIPQLPPLLICAAMTGIQKLRRMALKIMSSGYNNKVFTFPGLKLQQLLLYKDIDKIRADCELLGLTFVNQNILFQKANFKDEVQLTHPEMYYTDQSLHSVLPSVLLESM